MMTRHEIAGGMGCLVLAMFCAGCNHEEPETAQSVSSTTVHESAEPAVERPPLELPPLELPPLTTAESNPAGIVIVDATTDSNEQADTADDLRQLADLPGSLEEWEAAQNRILERGADAVPALATGLTSGTAMEREMAAMMLAVIGSGLDEAEPALRVALRDESQFVRANAATALCQLPDTEDAVIPVLAELLESPDPNLREIATTNLGNFGPEAAPFVESLAGSLEDDRPDVLMPIVELLGRIGPPAEAAAPKLRQIVFEQSGEVQAAATAALEQIESPAPTER